MMAKLENLKKKSLYPYFLSDFKNVGSKIFGKSKSITKKKIKSKYWYQNI